MPLVDLNGKVALVTGANSGIGRVTARELALKGYRVFLACRSELRTHPVLEEIAKLSNGTAKAEFIQLDLGDLNSVRQCATAFLAKNLSLHLLINNAGLAGQRGKTASGFELAFGTCHVGHFLLTQLLLDCLKASAPARVVMVSSKAHRHANDIDFSQVRQTTESVGGLKEYSVAKLANLLFSNELARQLQGTGVTTYAVHPGVVATDVWRAMPAPLAWLLKHFMRTAEQGATTSLYAATAPLLATQSGYYYADCQQAETSPTAQDSQLARRLWEQSERWVSIA